jgi:hypothetical protein
MALGRTVRRQPSVGAGFPLRAWLRRLLRRRGWSPLPKPAVNANTIRRITYL